MSAERSGKAEQRPADMQPDYWPSAKVTVHDDEVRFGVHRVTAELYAPGLPPGVYDFYLPNHPTESAEAAYIDRAGVIEKIAEALPKVGEPEAWCMLHATDLRWIKYELEETQRSCHANESDEQP